MRILHRTAINTPLGKIIVLADDHVLYLLEFSDRRDLDKKIERLARSSNSTIISGRTHVIDSIEQELVAYGAGNLREFKTQINPLGTPFQIRVWQTLQKIPFGETRSYRDIATALGKPTAFRAVALANSANPLAIIIPCHRVINANGNLGGYAGGLTRKKWLLSAERSQSSAYL